MKPAYVSNKTSLFILGLVVFLTSCNPYGKKLEYNGTEVYYTDLVERHEAEKLGDYLVSSEFADGNPKSVQLTKDKESGNYAFRMVTTPEAAKNKAYEVLFKVVAKQISDTVLNKAVVDFHVCDNTFKTLKVIPFKDEKSE